MLSENDRLEQNENENERRNDSWHKRLKYLASIFNSKSELNKISTSKYLIIKLIWFMCLIILILICTVLIANAINKYYKYEVSSKIRDIYPQRLAFPVITICNNNPMVTPEANEFIRKYYYNEYNVDISTSDEFFDLLNNGTINDENSFIEYMVNDPNFNATLRESFGYNYIKGDFIGDLNDYFDDYIQM